MKNQDMPANSVSSDDKKTKFEKAFWQVYSAMASNPEIATPYKDLAKLAIKAVNSGFEALEKRND